MRFLPTSSNLCLWLSALALSTACKSSSSKTKDAGTPIVKIPGELTPNDLSILVPMYNDAFARKNKLPPLKEAFGPALVKSSDMPNPQDKAAGQPAAALDNQPFLPNWAMTAIANQMYDDQAQRLLDPPDETDALMGCGAGPNEDQNPTVSHCDRIKEVFNGTYVAVAVRFDPCFNALQTHGDDSQCLPQMRLIWEKSRSEPVTSSTLADVSIHGVYQLTQQEFMDAIKTLTQLKDSAGFDYSHDPLEVHPVMVKQGPQGSYYQGIVGLIHRYARGNKLMILAGGTTITNSTHHFATNWMMATLTVNQNVTTKGSPSQLFVIPGSQPRYAQHFSSQALQEELVSSPPGANPDAVPMHYPPQDSSQVTAHAVAHAAMVVDPRRNDVFTLDCGSCHRVDLMLNALKADRFDAKTAYVSTRWNQQVPYDFGDFPYGVVKMFSYFAGSPMVKRRVINETIYVTDWVNSKYLISSDSAAAQAALAPTAPFATNIDLPRPATMAERYNLIALNDDGTYTARHVAVNANATPTSWQGTWTKQDATHISMTEAGSKVAETYPWKGPLSLAQYAGRPFTTDYEAETDDLDSLIFRTLIFKTDGSYQSKSGDHGGSGGGTAQVLWRLMTNTLGSSSEFELLPVVEFKSSGDDTVDLPFRANADGSFSMIDPGLSAGGEVDYEPGT